MDFQSRWSSHWKVGGEGEIIDRATRVQEAGPLGGSKGFSLAGKFCVSELNSLDLVYIFANII